MPTQFQEEVDSVFDLRYLELGRSYLDCGFYSFSQFPDNRVNHYLIKSSDREDYQLGEVAFPEMKEFIDRLHQISGNLGVNVLDRYCYFTMDQGWVEPGSCLRQAGWHLDGLQGDEVPVKKPGDLQFVWTDCMPTIFSTQGFDVAGLDVSVHNVFSWLEKRVNPATEVRPQANRIVAMNSYHVHRAAIATEKVYRRFLRISYTYIPVTSTKMWINPEMTYNYPIHVTTGEIPSHLK